MSDFQIGDQVHNRVTGETGRVTDTGPHEGLLRVRYGMQRTAKITAMKDLEKSNP